MKELKFLNKFNREDYLGFVKLKNQFNQTEVARFVDAKFQQVRDYVTRNLAVFNTYEDNLQKELFDMSMATVKKVQEYMAAGATEPVGLVGL